MIKKTVKKYKIQFLVVLSICLFMRAFFFGILLVLGILLRRTLLKEKNVGFKYLKIIIFILVLTISIRLFLLEIYSIPSRSMESYLHPGDIVLINRLSYGPRLPSNLSEIPVLNVIFRGSAGKISLGNFPNLLRYQRFAKVKNGDVLVFSSIDKKSYLVKRIIALPGQNITQREDSTFIEGKYINGITSMKYTYTVKAINKGTFTEYTKKEGFETDTTSFRVDSSLQVTIHPGLKNEIPGLSSIKITENPQEGYFERERKGWTLDKFGPILVPYKGLLLKSSDRHIQLYYDLLKRFEGVQLLADGNFYLESEKKQTSTYMIKNDYLFVMGDNRNHSYDSRSWGFLPFGNVEGIVWLTF